MSSTEPESYLCTYCTTPLADFDEAGPGDELHCENCDVTYDLVAESDLHDLVVFVCPYCGAGNKRVQSVERVVCENDGRVNGEDCGLEFDPAGVKTQPVAESDQDERPKMVPRDVGGRSGGGA